MKLFESIICLNLYVRKLVINAVMYSPLMYVCIYTQFESGYYLCMCVFVSVRINYHVNIVFKTIQTKESASMKLQLNENI